jgi:membrane-associated progesterone receptor component
MPDTNVVAIYTSGLLAALTLTYFILRQTSPDPPQPQTEDTNSEPRTGGVMQPPNDNLAEPLDVPYTQEQLGEFDGSDPSKPIYVAIKGLSLSLLVTLHADGYEGTIFDVSKKVDVYGKGKSYNLFAGKDASKALGMSSLKPEDAVSDYSALPENERNVLEEWYLFFEYVYHLAILLAHMSNPPLGSGTTLLARLSIYLLQVPGFRGLILLWECDLPFASATRAIRVDCRPG